MNTHPPWWPSQLQGEPWDCITLNSIEMVGGPNDADRFASEIAEENTSDHEVWELIPSSDELYKPAIAEMRRRFASDNGGCKIDDDGRIQFSDGVVAWLRLLRFRKVYK